LPDAGPSPIALGDKYAGQIFFHTKPIAPDSSDDSSVVTSWTLGSGPLYISYSSANKPSAVIDHNPREQCPYPYQTDVRYVLNGEGTFQQRYRMDQEIANMDARLGGSLLQHPEIALGMPLPADLASDLRDSFYGYEINKLKPGENTLTLAVTVGCSAGDKDHDSVIALGELKIIVPPGGKGAFLAAALPPAKPSAHPENSQIAKDGTPLLQADPHWKGRTVLSVQTDQADWIPMRNEFGVLISRGVNATIYWQQASDDAGVCRCTTGVVFQRDVAGGPLVMTNNGMGTRDQPFACSEVPK
jgi:hypothetical protein